MPEKAVIIKKVILTTANVDKFHQLYRGLTNQASLSWVLDLLLEKFLESHTHTPEELAAIGAAELRKMLQGEQK